MYKEESNTEKIVEVTLEENKLLSKKSFSVYEDEKEEFNIYEEEKSFEDYNQLFDIEFSFY